MASRSWRRQRSWIGPSQRRRAGSAGRVNLAATETDRANLSKPALMSGRARPTHWPREPLGDRDRSRDLVEAATLMSGAARPTPIGAAGVFRTMPTRYTDRFGRRFPHYAQAREGRLCRPNELSDGIPLFSEATLTEPIKQPTNLAHQALQSCPYSNSLSASISFCQGWRNRA
jgi:hypothetical protein